jgi:hypothetical protein
MKLTRDNVNAMVDRLKKITDNHKMLIITKYTNSEGVSQYYGLGLRKHWTRIKVPSWINKDKVTYISIPELIKDYVFVNTTIYPFLSGDSVFIPNYKSDDECPFIHFDTSEVSAQLVYGRSEITILPMNIIHVNNGFDPVTNNFEEYWMIPNYFSKINYKEEFELRRSNTLEYEKRELAEMESDYNNGFYD